MTISGDTARCDNLVTLAQGTNLLLHEAIDLDWVRERFDKPNPVAQATLSHHLRSHTGAADVVDLAIAAGAKSLALHHLVPANAPADVWQRALAKFDGASHLPDDLSRIPFGAI